MYLTESAILSNRTVWEVIKCLCRYSKYCYGKCGYYQESSWCYRSADSVKAFTDDMLCHKAGEKIKRSDVYKLYEEYCEENGRTPHGKSRFWEYMADKGFVIKRYSDGTYYFKDTSVNESDFKTMDDTIENLFEQMDLSLS